jgi:hypothetical protein
MNVQKNGGSIGINKNFYNDGKWTVNSLHKTFCLLTQSCKETGLSSKKWPYLDYLVQYRK